jgi:hypothetical protein
VKDSHASYKSYYFKVMLNTLKDIRKCRRMLGSLLGGSLLMISSGMHIAFGIFNPYIQNHHFRGLHSVWLFLIIASWFIGAIVGFVAAPVYNQTFTKKTIYVRMNMFH